MSKVFCQALEIRVEPKKVKNFVVAILVSKFYQNDPKNNFGYQKQYILQSPKNPKIAISIYTREAMFVSLRSNKRSSDRLVAGSTRNDLISVSWKIQIAQKCSIMWCSGHMPMIWFPKDIWMKRHPIWNEWESLYAGVGKLILKLVVIKFFMSLFRCVAALPKKVEENKQCITYERRAASSPLWC